MKKAFTLVELLAVIAIIAVIALVTTPIVIDVITSSREKAFINSAHGLVVSASTYQAERQALNEDTTLFIDYKESDETVKDLLKTDGKLPDAGEFMIDSLGKVTLALWSDEAHICVVKGAKDKEILVNESITSALECTIDNINKE